MSSSDSSLWWAPHSDGYLGFNVRDVKQAFDEACRRLSLRPTDRFDPRPQHRHRSGLVMREDGSRAWLKVGGIYRSPNFYLDGELSAFENGFQPKPGLLDQIEWVDATTTWTALLMSYVEFPIVSRYSFAASDGVVSDSWLLGLKQALARVRSCPAPRISVHREAVSSLIGATFGASAASLPVGELNTAHGDVNWSNLTHPQFVLLDWELWGAAPLNYDVGYLMAFSAVSPDLVRRLENVFAEELAQPGAAAVQLYNIAKLLASVDAGQCSASVREPLMRMADELLARS